jgi:hypothetical protein
MTKILLEAMRLRWVQSVKIPLKGGGKEALLTCKRTEQKELTDEIVINNRSTQSRFKSVSSLSSWFSGDETSFIIDHLSLLLDCRFMKVFTFWYQSHFNHLKHILG